MNLLTTIPKSKFTGWDTCEIVCRMCDGETPRRFSRGPWFWLINCQRPPTKITVGESVCFMIYDGQIRGWFQIVDITPAAEWEQAHREGQPRPGFSVVMAGWHPITPIPHTGFQGYRYTELRP